MGMEPIDMTQLLNTAQDLMNALMPIFMVIAMFGVGVSLMEKIVRMMRDTLNADTPAEQKSKPKNDDYPPMVGIEYETINGYLLPKRKNSDLPVRLGDDGELILPESFQDHIEE